MPEEQNLSVGGWSKHRWSGTRGSV